jgi:hypothetical protein
MVLLLGLTRIVFAMSRDGLLPRGASRTSPKYGTPVRLQIGVGVVVAIIAGLSKVELLEEMINIGTLSAFVLVSFGIPVLRKRRPDLERGFRVPWSPALPIIAGVACLWLMANLTTLTWLRFLAWLVVGVVIYFAYSYKHSIGQPPVYPRNDLDYSANFLHMMFSTPCEEYRVDPVKVRALERLLILHADHEQNCSTSTVRLVGSSTANLYASIAAGISALWGPVHGGANQEVIEMLTRIDAEGGDADRFVAQARQKGSARLMGFGHRVYKNFDPRAQVLKESCRELRDSLDGRGSRLLDIAFRLEEVALEDDYFIQRKLYPNVDFYSGILYLMLGIPVNLFTAMFALGRMPGWIAHWLEMKRDPATRIGRPRQIYVGPSRRPYVPRPERF